MSRSEVTHEWDPSCPFCQSDDVDDLIAREIAESEKEADRQRRRSVVSKRVASAPKESIDEERLPPWVDPNLQPEHVRRLLPKR